MHEQVERIANALGAYQHQHTDNPIDDLAALLKADKSFLGIVLALTNLSQEKFLRILSAERFAQNDFDVEWSIEKIHRKLTDEVGFAERIAQLFLDGRSSLTLVQYVAQFYLEQLSLPADWDKVIKDPQLIRNVARRKLAGQYTDQKGDAVETLIRTELERIKGVYGVSHGKGQVQVVNKEVDHAIPSVDDAHVLIMTSYMETTSSSQTDRADKQITMYIVHCEWHMASSKIGYS